MANKKIRAGDVPTEVLTPSDARQRLIDLIEEYKIKNPKKYAQKKVALEAQLAALEQKEKLEAELAAIK